MKLNDTLIKLFSEFHRALDNLQRLSNISQEKFLTDMDKVSSAKYNLVVAIEVINN